MKKYLLIVAILSASYVPGFGQTLSQAPTANVVPVVLRGTILLPDGVIKHGYVAIENGFITSVSDEQPNLPNANYLNTHGIILPGFVDLHNHLRTNVMPRWNPDQIYANRYEWRNDPGFIQSVSGPIDRLASSNFCDMNRWAELRALVGGTTSIMTTKQESCIHGLVRNLDHNSGFYGTTELDREHIYNVLDLPPPNTIDRALFVGGAHYLIGLPFYESLIIHLAEGTDAASEEEFTFIQSQSLLNPKGVIIHGIPLTAADYQAMASHGTALIWSPRSNLELYGATNDLNAALDAGVEIALAPDWAITGSSNTLNELKVADEYNRVRLAGRLTDRQLVDMATSIPAHIAGIDDQVGAIRVGLRADILVINGDHNNPYRSVIDATADDVQLVFINGIPIYGDRIFMEHFWERSELEEINLPEAPKTIAIPMNNDLVAGIKSRLQLAMDGEAISLAPLIESNDFIVPAIPTARTNGAPDVKVDQEINSRAKLTVTAFPNPGRREITIRTQTSSDELIQLRVLDVLGRVMETRKGITANTSFRIGNNFQPGIYFAEVVQGSQRQIVKVIRQ